MLVLVGPCPFLCCFAVLLGGETQIWLGDLRVVFFLAVVLVVWFVSHDDLPEIFGPHVSCTLLLFTAYAIVRTVPSANRPNRKEKKVRVYVMPEYHACIVMILSYHLLHPSFSPINWCRSRHCSVLGFVFGFVCFCVSFCFALVSFVSFCVLDDRDSIQDYVSVLHQFTFAATLQRRLTHDLINRLIPIATCPQTC